MTGVVSVRRISVVGFALAVTALVIAAFTALGSSTPAAAAPSPCKVIIALDRSGSIGSARWKSMGNQVLQLFGAGGIDRDDIEIAFWTFSHTFDAGNKNFNAPYHGYVKSNATVLDSGYNAFKSSLGLADPDAILGGETNYAQGFGYDTPERNPLSLPKNQSASIATIASQASVITFLTDGIPNYPGGMDFDDDGWQAGYAARQKYDASVAVIGGYLNSDENSSFVPSSLYQAINGPGARAPADNIGPLDFGSLNDFLMVRIPLACGASVNAYELRPVVTSTSHAVMSGKKASFNYVVNNTSDNQGSSDWRVFDVTIAPGAGAAGDPFACGGTGYCGGINDCVGIRTLIGGPGAGTCKAADDDGDGVPDGNGTGDRDFPIDVTRLYGGIARDANNDTAAMALGTRVCRVLVLERATSVGGSRLHGACTVIGKTPLVQIHGGDVRVGRLFKGDSAATTLAGVFTTNFSLSGAAAPNGVTFGSWTEYGVLAPGTILSMASLSGYADGYIRQPSVPPGCAPGADKGSNRLTFANSGASGCGGMQGAPGMVPDIVSAARSWRVVNNLVSGTVQLSGGPGLYQNEEGTSDVRLGATTIDTVNSTDNTYVVYVPNATLTIEGDIRVRDYASRTYANEKEVPQLIVIAKNINVAEGVRYVDAWLVASGSGNDGVVNTCTGYGGSFSPTVCDDDLYVNGPVFARQLHLWRTTVYAGQCTIDNPGALSDPALSVPSGCVRDIDDPAETVNLPASTLLWALSRGAHGNLRTTQSVELPPLY